MRGNSCAFLPVPSSSIVFYRGNRMELPPKNIISDGLFRVRQTAPPDAQRNGTIYSRRPNRVGAAAIYTKLCTRTASLDAIRLGARYFQPGLRPFVSVSRVR